MLSAIWVNESIFTSPSIARYATVTHIIIYRITGNVCVTKFFSLKFLRDLIFAQTEHAQYKMHILHVVKFSRFIFAKIKSQQTHPVIRYYV